MNKYAAQFWILPLAVSIASAEDFADLTDMSLDELMNITVVSASKYPQSLLASPSAVSIISQEDIAHSPAQTLPELLQYVVGMDGYTKTHTDMDVAARGFAFDETSKMLVLVDNQPVNVVPYSGMQWPTLPLTLDDIKRIEVVRGSASSIYGADALVGIINIITLEAGERSDRVSLSLGERGALRAGVRIGKPLDKNWTVAFGAGFTRTEEKGDAETPEAKEAAPNYGVKDWADIYRGTYRLDYDGDDLSFNSSGGVTSDEEGYNPSPGDHSIDRSEKRTFFTSNTIRKTIGDDQLAVRVGLRTLSQENQRWDGQAYVFKYKIEKGDAVDFDANYTLGRYENSTVVGGVSASYLQASRDIANEPPYIYDEDDRLFSAYAQEELHLFGRRLSLTVGGRYDKWESLDGVVSPKAAMNLCVVKSRAYLRLCAGSSFRRPGFDENFYFVTWPGGWFKGANIGEVTESGQVIEANLLEPEKMTAYEAGIRITPSGSELIVVETFYNEVEDNIGYTVYESSDSTLNLGFANTGDKVTVKGIEAEYKRYLTKRLSTFLNYTWQTATIEQENVGEEDWKNVPEHKASGGVRYLGTINVDARFRYVGEVAYQEFSSTPVDEYWTVDLALSHDLPSGMNVKLSVLNLLDDEHYEYPLYTTLRRRAIVSVQHDF